MGSVQQINVNNNRIAVECAHLTLMNRKSCIYGVEWSHCVKSICYFSNLNCFSIFHSFKSGCSNPKLDNFNESCTDCGITMGIQK